MEERVYICDGCNAEKTEHDGIFEGEECECGGVFHLKEKDDAEDFKDFEDVDDEEEEVDSDSL